MRRTVLVAIAVVCALASADGARAQRRQHDDTDDKLPPSVPPALSTLPPTRGISGPRLEPGAVLCRSELDLQHRAEVNRRSADNVPDPGNPLENCHLLSRASGVEVVDKHGLGRTEVKVKPSGELGWTDAYVR